MSMPTLCVDGLWFVTALGPVPRYAVLLVPLLEVTSLGTFAQWDSCTYRMHVYLWVKLVLCFVVPLRDMYY